MRPGEGTNPTLPDDLIEVGYVGGAYGIRGWIKVQLHGDADALLHARTWWLKPATGALATSTDWRVFPVGTSREHSGTVVAGSPAAPDRNVAEALRGYAVWVSRADFPEPDDDEFYWVDLIGATVVNEQQETLGTVGGLIDNGAHQILRIVGEGEVERLVPFVEVYVKSVDVAGKRIVVDWGLDY
nr:ribosome maturation factor RimM [Ralstonia sp. SET104]